ncbi:hypothetical protein FZ934_11615 [Rhizobium grahamii]|uniref:O-antigen polysaccharide polymerase Wzy n=1 Tax=Rhizobium grahamii TaxID=1120045 RepID=A0A5Q0C6E0_9HYPH|nr:MULTISPECIES: hypothetical protein [Rhizobium]QFY61003.1 hypothetical protein FZ934_11615 [Rhizobium grahamii]QRM49847.1 hypothetical protein F3Y33_11275 [Rhizobium sp. BG6]
MTRLCAVLLLYLLNLPFADSLFVVLLTLPMLLLVLTGMIRMRSPVFQIGDVFWFCLFVFFVLSPLQRMHGEMIGGTTAITFYAYEPYEYVEAMLIVLLFCVPFLAVRMERDASPVAKAGLPFLTTLLFLNVAAFGLFVVSEGGFERLLSSRLEQDPAEAFIASMLFLGVQSITTCLVSIHLRAFPSRLAPLGVFVLVICLLSISRNPFNSPRFMLLAVWGPVLLALVGGRISAWKFYAVAVIALTVLFPVLSVTTRLGLEGAAGISEISFAGNFFDVPAVDVFDMAVHAVRFMQTHEHMWGAKSVAVILFFVPRALWPGKPIVGGLDIGNELFAAGMYGTPNLSFFLGCDLFMDFGFVGVVFGGIVVAALLQRGMKTNVGLFAGQPVTQFVIASSLPILLRGPVGAVLPLFCCQMFAVVVLSLLTRSHQSLSTDAREAHAL